MEQAIRSRFNDEVYRELLRRHRIEENSIRPLGGFESFVYQFVRENKEYILRISHTGLRRSKGQIAAEVDFINYLAEHGVPAARAVPSPAGNLLEAAVDTDPDFVAVAFEKAPGGPPPREIWTPGFFARYGQVMGKMHRLTMDYVPSDKDNRRPDGMEDLEGFAERFLPPSETEVMEKWNRLLAYMEKLPRDQDAYGLIHQDLHGGNFFVDADGNITVFDFDDCQYFWFAHDIAMALFYVVPHHCVEKEDQENARQFLEHFLQGYRSEYELKKKWILEIPTFLSLREMDLYIAIHRSMDLDHLTPWCASFMENRREKILQGIPYVDLGWLKA